MDSVIDKLTEIEQTASAIVAHAEEEKAEIDREYDERRKKFDQKLEEETMVRIERIREGLESDKKHLLTGQEESSRELIASLQEEYTKNHTVYAENKSVPEAVTYLIQNTVYREILETLEPTLVHRGNIEKLLIVSLYQDYTRIYLFATLEQRKFLKLYLKRYEVELINYCLRIVINHYQEPFDLNHKRAFFDRYSQISIEKLIHSRTTDELIENLKGTEYYNTLKKLRDSGKATLFDYDLALNLYYFVSMWKQRKKILKPKELELFTRDYGAQINMLNIQWIYRAKKYFNLSPADIYALLIPIQYKISTVLIKEMVEASDLDAFQKAVEKTSYAKHFDFSQNLTVEKLYTDYLYYLYRSDRRKDPYSIASINTYLFLKEEEIKKLTTVIECVRYGIPPEEIRGYTGGQKL